MSNSIPRDDFFYPYLTFMIDSYMKVGHYRPPSENPFKWNIAGGSIGVQEYKIHHECEVGIEKSLQRITDWHHEACLVMTKTDFFLSHPHTNNGFFFLLTTKYLILYWKKTTTLKKLPENPEYAEMRHGDVILTLQWRHGLTCGQREAVRHYLSLWLVRVCQIDISQMGKINGNTDLVCENANYLKIAA